MIGNIHYIKHVFIFGVGIYAGVIPGALAQGTAASTVLLLATAVILIPWIIVEFGKKSRR